MPFIYVLIVAVTALSTLTGCSNVPVVAISKPSPNAQAEVLIFRDSAFIAGAVSLTVGTGDKAFAKISNSEYVSVYLPVGAQDIFVQARSADPTKVNLALQHGSRVCLRTSSSSSTLAKIALPVSLIATGYHFYLDEVPCPSAEELAKYLKVPVNYSN